MAQPISITLNTEKYLINDFVCGLDIEAEFFAETVRLFLEQDPTLPEAYIRGCVLRFMYKNNVWCRGEAEDITITIPPFEEMEQLCTAVPIEFVYGLAT